MAKKASKKAAAAKTVKAAKIPPFTFRTYDDNAGGFKWALLRSKDGRVVADSGPVPFSTAAKAREAVGEVIDAVMSGNIAVMKATD